MKLFVTLNLSALAILLLNHCAPNKLGFTATPGSTTGSDQQGSSIGGPTGGPTPTPAALVTPTPIPNPSPTPTSSPVVTPGRPSNSENIKVCDNGVAVPGLDVSDYDPNTQWSQIKKDGKGFTFIKATESIDFTNPSFSRDWVDAPAVGILRGAYHFFHPGDNPTTQAQFFLNTVGKLQTNDLPAMLDWEVADGVSTAVQIQNAKIWLKAVEAATGKIPIIYVDYSFWNSLGNPSGFERYPLFIAHYNVDCPLIPPPWSSWTFWQTGTEPLSGVTASKADIDTFNGSAAQLLNFAQTGSR